MTDKTWPKPSDVDRVISKVKSDDAFKSQLLRDANAVQDHVHAEAARAYVANHPETTMGEAMAHT